MKILIISNRKKENLKIENIDINQCKIVSFPNLTSSINNFKKIKNEDKYHEIIIDSNYASKKDIKKVKILLLTIRAKSKLIINSKNELVKISYLSTILLIVSTIFQATIILFFLFFAYLYSLTWLIIFKYTHPKKIELKNNNQLIKIAFLRSTIGPTLKAGGSYTHILGFCKAALNLNHKITIFSSSNIANTGNVSIELIKQLNLFNIFPEIPEILQHFNLIIKVNKKLKKSSTTHIYQRHDRFNFSGQIISRKLNLPVVLEFNSSEVWKGKHWGTIILKSLAYLMERAALHGSDYISVVSQNMKNQLTLSGISKDKIIVNPNGVDEKEFNPEIDGQNIRSKYNLQNKFVVGFTGTFGIWHGVPILINAIKEIAPKHEDIHFLIVGHGKSANQEKEKINQAGLSKSVTFCGLIEHSLIPQYLASMDILVSPHVPLANNTPFFGSPTKLFEYMSMGKGIVASNLGQIGEILNEKSAILVKPGDVEELLDGILMLYNNRHLITDLGKNARLIIENNYTWTANAQRIINLLNK